MDRKHNLAFYQALKYFPCRICLSSPVPCIQIIYLRRSHKGKLAIFEKWKKGIFRAAAFLQRDQVFPRALHSQSVLISSLLTSCDVFSLHRVSIKRGVNACFRRLLRVPVTRRYCQRFIRFFTCPGQFSKLLAKLFQFSRCIVHQVRRGRLALRFSLGTIVYYHGIIPLSIAFLGLSHCFTFCTNSPALFCAICTPCPLGQTPPALIIHARVAL